MRYLAQLAQHVAFVRVHDRVDCEADDLSGLRELPTLQCRCVAALLGVLAVLGRVSAASLLAITFLWGVGSALMAPADLKPAVALNSLGLDIARTSGPTLGGLLIRALGVSSAFFVNAASKHVVVAALLLWNAAVGVPQSLPERFMPAMIAGARSVADTAALKRVLWRSAAYFLFALEFWALEPLVARQSLDGDASHYASTPASHAPTKTCKPRSRPS